MKTVLVSMVDVKLLKSPSFLLLAFGGFLTMCGFFVPFIYLGRQAIAVGIPKSQATMLVSVLGVVNIVARICCGCGVTRNVSSQSIAVGCRIDRK